MAFRNVAVPWLSGGLIVLGYAAFSWLRTKRARPTDDERAERAARPARSSEPRSMRLEQLPDEQALDFDSQAPANRNARSRSADLGALFLGRASEALSPFHMGPEWPPLRRGD